MALQPEDRNLALYCDFENIALGVRDAKYRKFNIQHVLERLLVKGSIVVKKAYCDWDRYREFKGPMHEASFELIEIPHVRMSGKNSADIRMVVDALDLCYTKSHVDTFVIISGDSDFSPLVSKLRENAKTVIGVGVKNSTSDLLIGNCDEFIYYDDLVRELERQRTPPRDGASRGRGNGSRKRSGRSGRGRGGAEAPSAETAQDPRAAEPAPTSPPPVREDAAADGPAGGAPEAAPDDADRPRRGRGGRNRRSGRGAPETRAGETASEARSGEPAPEAPVEEAAPSPAVPESAPPSPVARRAGSESDDDYHDVGVGDDDEPFVFAHGAPDDPSGTADPRDAAEEDGDEEDDDESDEDGAEEDGADEDDEDERRQEGIDLVYRTASALSAERGGKDKLWGSMIKQTLKRRRPGFNESYYGFDSFSKMLEEAEAQELVTLEADERSGGYVILDIAS